jgi:hypothetical protein
MSIIYDVLKLAVFIQQKGTLDILELFAIILAAGFGIAGSATETKDKTGRLTRWGIIAVIGVIISNSFQFIQSHLKQQEEKDRRISDYKEKAERDSIEKVEYLEQMGILKANKDVSDKSLEEQLVIQNHTNKMLGQINRSVGIQSEIFKRSETLGLEQQKTLSKIDRTLNPLMPFAISLNFILKPNETERNNLYNAKEYLRKINNSTKEPDQIGVFLMVGRSNLSEGARSDTSYMITPESKWFNEILAMFKESNFEVTFRHRNSYKHKVSFQIDFDKINLPSYINEITYSAYNGFHFHIKNLPVEILTNLGATSTYDLTNSDYSIYFNSIPGYVFMFDTIFKFPPEYSTARIIKGFNQKANSKLNIGYFSYSDWGICDSLSTVLDQKNLEFH